MEVCSCDKDCSNGICGRLYASAEAPKKCCPITDSVYGGSGEIGMCCKSSGLSGQPCNVDEICQSGICILGTCKEGKQVGDSACGDIKKDLTLTQSIRYEPVDHHCLSGKCGRKEVLLNAPNVCCSSGEAVYTGNKTGYVCTERKVGSVCANEPLVCESRICNDDGICIDKTYQWRNFSNSSQVLVKDTYVSSINETIFTSSVTSSAVNNFIVGGVSESMVHGILIMFLIIGFSIR